MKIKENDSSRILSDDFDFNANPGLCYMLLSHLISLTFQIIEQLKFHFHTIKMAFHNI